jgi:hypothetical protein
MRNAGTARLACGRCHAPMDLLEGVPVLQSLKDHAIFECEWCGHIALVRKHELPGSPSWIGSIPPGVPGVSIAASHSELSVDQAVPRTLKAYREPPTTAA